MFKVGIHFFLFCILTQPAWAELQNNVSMSMPSLTPGTSGTCTSSLAAGSTCTVVLQFAPTAVGANSQTYKLFYFTGSANAVVSVGLTGTGQ